MSPRVRRAPIAGQCRLSRSRRVVRLQTEPMGRGCSRAGHPLPVGLVFATQRHTTGAGEALPSSHGLRLESRVSRALRQASAFGRALVRPRLLLREVDQVGPRSAAAPPSPAAPQLPRPTLHTPERQHQRVMIVTTAARVRSAKSIPTIALLAGSNSRSRPSEPARLGSPRDKPIPSLTDVLLDAWDTKSDDRIRRTSSHPTPTRWMRY